MLEIGGRKNVQIRRQTEEIAVVVLGLPYGAAVHKGQQSGGAANRATIAQLVWSTNKNRVP